MTDLGIAKTGRWMHHNARGLELAKWRLYFEGGGAEAVADELQYYQNTDGGFTHALEAGCRNPASAPSQMFYAIHIPHELDYKDKTHPVIQGMMRYLESGRDMEDGFWINILSSSSEYPHTPWWMETEKKTFDVYIPNADIYWFTLNLAQRDSSLYTKAELMVQRMLDLLLLQKEIEPHSLESMIFPLHELQKTGSFCGPQTGAVATHGIQLMRGLIEEDPDHWGTYCTTPSFFIHDRLHPLYPEYGALLKLEIRRIMETGDTEGRWNINWIWRGCGNEPRLNTDWWKSSITVQRLILYEAFV